MHLKVWQRIGSKVSSFLDSKPSATTKSFTIVADAKKDV